MVAGWAPAGTKARLIRIQEIRGGRGGGGGGTIFEKKRKTEVSPTNDSFSCRFQSLFSWMKKDRQTDRQTLFRLEMHNADIDI